MAAQGRKAQDSRGGTPPGEEFLRAVWEGSEHALWLVEVVPGSGFRMLALNRRGREALEIPPGTPAGEIASLLPPSLVAGMRERLQEAVESGFLSFEFTLSPGGREARWWATLRAVASEKGEGALLVGSALEVTAQKEMEQTLAFLGEELSRLAGEEFHKGLLRFLAARKGVTGACLSLLDREGRLLHALIHTPPDGWERGTEFPPEGTACQEVLRQGELIIPRGAREMFPADPLLSRMEGEGYAGIRLRDGEGRGLGVLAAIFRAPLAAEDEPRLPLLLHLLAERASGAVERKRILAALEEREAFFRGVFERAAVGMGVADMKGNPLQVNPAYCSIMGYTEEEIRRLGFDGLTHPDDRTLNDDTVARVGRGKVQSLTVEKRYLHKSGRVVHGRLTLSLIRDAGGNPWRMLGVMEDVTDRKAWQAEVERSREQLRNLAARREREMEMKRAAIARELHDQVGQDLTALKMEALWLRDRDPEGGNAGRFWEMSEIIDGCLATVRRIARTLRPELLERLGLEDAVEATLSDFTRRAGVETHLTIFPRPLGLDRERSAALYRILQEALTNVTRHAFAHEVGVRLAREGRGVVLEVRDDGEGVPSARAGGYMSLGILGMQERALALGGEVQVEPGEGGGTVVRATLPLEA